MELIFLLLCVAIPAFGENDKQQMLLVTKNEIEIKTPGKLTGGPHAWVLKGHLGAKLVLECDDIDIPESDGCKDGSLLIRDGLSKNNQNVCGKKTGIKQETTHGILLLYLDLKDSSGSFSCRAKLISQEPQEDIVFKTNAEASPIVSKTKDQIETWDITAPKGASIEFSCKVFAVYGSMIFPGETDCTHQYLEMDLGDGGIPKKVCGAVRVHEVSKGNRMVLRLVGSHVRRLECTADSSGPSPIQYFKDIPSEEIDSSEFGNGKGSKLTTCDCGRANKQKSRIIYGIDAVENEFPWAVSLQTIGGFHFCGGSIVSKRHVVSCAHCTKTKVASQTQIVAGGSHLKKSKHLRRYDVLRIINHDYQTHPTRRDICILITKDEIEFSATVGPICLPDKDPEMVGKYVTAVGWGQMAPSERGTRDQSQLKKTHLRIVHPKWCSQMWKDDHFDTEGKTHICTWSNHTDICMGDSGGPVTWVDPDTNRYFLVGCPSLCDGCNLRLPSLHTAMFAYFKWITGIIAEYEHPENVCTKIE